MSMTKTKHSAAQNAAKQLQGLELLGEVITFGSRSFEGKRHQRADVVKALSDSGLDPSAAKEFKPLNAFHRASKRLQEERIIDVLREEKSLITFQFSKRFLDESGKELHYKKDKLLTLNKVTGKIECSDKNMQDLAQAELDKALEERTTSDITGILQTLFREHADLAPLPGSMGVYFVPREHNEFLGKVKDFLHSLGRTPFALPVPRGTRDGDSAVQASMKEYLQGMLDSHVQAIESFTTSTRQGTLEETATKINVTRAKILAYAEYLKDMAGDLLGEVEKSKELLKEKALELAKEKAAQESSDQPEGKDRFGQRASSQAAKINSCLNGVGKTPDEVCEETKLGKGRVRSHLNYGVENGWFVEEKGRYRLAPKWVQ